MLPFDLPPAIPIVAPAPADLQSHPAFLLLSQSGEKEQPSAEKKAFHEKVQAFQEHLALLSPEHKSKIKELHGEVSSWADKSRKAGQKADKLSTFVGKVMTYADTHLKNIEKTDPELKMFQEEHKQFHELFVAGADVIDAYLAWVRTDYEKSKSGKT